MVRRRVTLSSIVFVVALACANTALPEADPVEGLIVGIEGSTMTLETSGGDRFAFRIADPDVPVGHLHEHMDQDLPVSVRWEGEGELLAVEIGDA